MEKVENLYRTARAQNDSIDTSEHIGSHLRDSLSADGECARFFAARRSCGRMVVAAEAPCRLGAP